MPMIPMNVMNFAGEENITVYEQFRDYFNHYKALNFGSKASYIEGKSLDEKEAKLNAGILKEVARFSGVNLSDKMIKPEVFATNPQVVWAAFAVVGAMIDMILPETIIESTGLYTEVRTGGYGDSFSFDVKPRDLFAVSKHGRARRLVELKKQFVGQVTIVPEAREISVQVSLYRILSGKESLAEFAMKAVRSIETEMAKDVYMTFDEAMDKLPTTPVNGELKATGYSRDTLVKFCQRVSAYNNGAKPVIVGTQLALSKILPDDANYRFTLDSDYVKIGYLKTFNGYDTMVLPQVADWKEPYKMALNDKKIYIISPSSQKLVKLCLEGSTMTNTTGTYDMANLLQTTTMAKSWGTGIATNAIAAQITLA